MGMHAMMYDQSSVLITGSLLLVLLAANELGYRLGRRDQAAADDSLKSQTNAIQGATLGLLALLLGFTFSLALQRYEARSNAVVEEANAIGRTYLRAQLLPSPHRENVVNALREYLDLRDANAVIDLTRTDPLNDMRHRVSGMHTSLWSTAVSAVRDEPQLATTRLFVRALNDMIDTYRQRQAALERHVPEVVLLLLFAIVIIALGILGYACGLGGSRPLFATVAIAALIVLTIFIVIDLDRPRRGLIQVNQSSLTELRAFMERS